jgi:DNA-directed RNA polymerase alpha subunit
MATDKEKILQKKISDLPFTTDFKSVSQKLGFNTIADIVAIHVSALVELDGITYHMLQEFTQYMQENNLSHLIKQH